MDCWVEVVAFWHVIVEDWAIKELEKVVGHVWI